MELILEPLAKVHNCHPEPVEGSRNIMISIRFFDKLRMTFCSVLRLLQEPSFYMIDKVSRSYGTMGKR